MKLGQEILFEKHLDLIEGRRVGLLAHHASIDSSGVHVLARFLEASKKGLFELTAVFAPEHGFEGKAQDMEPVLRSRLPAQNPKTRSQIPVHSLYGDSFASLSPTPAMLENVDVLVVDLQDIGSRYYTYANTMALSMRACSALKKDVIVCDRPNPINGVDAEGAPLDGSARSFVGMYPIRVRHAMTIGEYAKMAARCDALNESFLHVVPMQGWRREQFFDETGLKWVNPSPNMRSLSAALLYPGMCLLEGTNMSEGRGTHTPFETVGAPWIDATELAKNLKALKLKGIDFDTTVFTPTDRKFKGERCEGLQFIITDRKAFRPYLTGLALIHAVALTYPKHFEWRREPYEFVSDIPAIDLLTGGPLFRKLVGKKRPFEEIAENIAK
jgi:uncharacterized protein YbbC (DUF1343 family)